MPKTLNVLGHLQDQRARQELFNRQKAQQDLNDIKKFHSTTEIPKYDRLIGEEAQNVTKNAHSDLMQYGVISPKTKLQIQDLQNLNSRGIAHREEMKRLLDEEYKKKEADKYYDPTINIERINKLIPNRGLSLKEELDTDESGISDNRADIGHPQDISRTFKHDDYLGDYTSNLLKSKKTKENTFIDANGVKHASTIESLFTDKNGIPTNEPTVEDSREFLNSHSSVKPFYTHKAIEEISNEVDENRAHNPDWMARMSKGDIISGIIDGQIKNPHPNAVGNLNERILKMAGSDLKNHAHVLSKIDTDLSNTGDRSWGITNKNIQVAEGFENKNFSSPSIAIVNPKNPTNPYLRLSTASNLRYNLDNGKIVTNKLPREFVLNGGIQMVPVKADGTPVDIQASSPEELAQKIKELPASEFGPGGIVGTKIAMRGQSVNKKQILDMGYVKMAELKQKVAANPNDTQSQQELTDMENILTQINADRELSPELMQKYLGVDVIQNELIPIDPDDPNSQQIKGLTGMNPYSSKVLNHFAPLKNAIEQRVKQSKEVERPAVKEYWNTEEGQKQNEKIKGKTFKIPVKGEIRDGYKFLGGEPGEQNNWQKVD